MALGMEMGLGPGHIVLDGDSASLTKKGQRPTPVSGPFYCVQSARCMKMPLGVEVGLSPVDFVSDGYPALIPIKGTEPHNFRPMSIVAKRLDGSRCHLVRR